MTISIKPPTDSPTGKEIAVGYYLKICDNIPEAIMFMPSPIYNRSSERSPLGLRYDSHIGPTKNKAYDVRNPRLWFWLIYSPNLLYPPWSSQHVNFYASSLFHFELSKNQHPIENLVSCRVSLFSDLNPFIFSSPRKVHCHLQKKNLKNCEGQCGPLMNSTSYSSALVFTD